MRPYLLGFLTLILFIARPAAAQEPPLIPARLRLFLDCHTRCDQQYLRTEVTIVDWVTDRTAADVHVIATGLSTGSGGRQVTMAFIGRGALTGLTDTVGFNTTPDATDDVYRQEFARVLRLGLVRYLLALHQAGNLVLGLGEMSAAPSSNRTDPWDHWVFSIGTDGQFDAASQQKQYQLSTELRADRVTDAWKIRLPLYGDLDRTSYILQDSSKFTANRDSRSVSALVARSAGPHLSLGGTGELRISKPDNLDLRARMAPAIEWDLFPYADATRRQLILIYSVGLTHYDYVDPTVFGKLRETRADHQFRVAYQSQQAWGTASVSGSASSFLDDWSKNRLSIYGSLGVRLARGLSFNIEGSYSRVRDQITLRKGNASDEEIFLQLRELATDYQAAMQVGLSYTFGSFFNTIVNPRFNQGN